MTPGRPGETTVLLQTEDRGHRSVFVSGRAPGGPEWFHFDQHLPMSPLLPPRSKLNYAKRNKPDAV